MLEHSKSKGTTLNAQVEGLSNFKSYCKKQCSKCFTNMNETVTKGIGLEQSLSATG